MEKIDDILIDFNNPPGALKPIAKNRITLPDKRTFWGIPRSVNIKKYDSLYVDGLEVPEALKVSDVNKLIQITLDQTTKNGIETIQGSMLKSFRINQFDLPFIIHLDPTVIKDFLDLKADCTLLVFAVKHRRKPQDAAELIQKYEVTLHLKKALCKPVDHFYFTIPELESGYEYHIANKLHIGNREIAYKAPVYYAETYDFCRLKSILKGFGQEVVYLADEAGLIKESDPSSNGTPLKEIHEETASDLITEFQDGSIVLKNLAPNNTITIPVYFDLDQYDSPLEEKKEFIISEIELGKGQKGFSDSRSDQCIITPDSRTTRLLKQVKFNENHRELNRLETFTIPQKIQWIPKKRATKSCFSIVLGNHAENNNGLVTIENLKIDFRFNEHSSSTIHVEDHYDYPVENPKRTPDIDLNGIFQLTLKHKNKTIPFLNQLNCPNGFASHYEFVVSFRHDQIKDIPHDSCAIDCELSFDYEERIDGTVMHKDHFKNVIAFNVEKNPGSYWLAVDYGTSACAAAFGDDDKVEEVLIDLQKPLKKYIHGTKYIPEYIEEYGTNYLASTITLKEGKTIENPEYGENLVHLSPTKEDNNYPIPYLKSLIGMENLPNFNGLFDDFEYEDTGNQVSFNKKPPKVEKIVTASYYSLLSHFVQEQVHEALEKSKKDRNELNKIIFTVPNSFTPKHITHIKHILSNQRFSYFKKEHTTFLSESDAIACYYVHNNRKEITEKRATNEEHVLVYDMGAGTLDLTYFKVQTGTKKKKVKILGKLGKTTAGNYLDYLLAKSIYDEHEELFQFDPTLHDTDRGSILSYKKGFKKLIKDTIKPKLSTDFEYEIPNEGDTENLVQEPVIGNTEDLCNAVPIQDFISDNTHTLMENFFQLFAPEHGGLHRKGETSLDTVIFAGRSMLFKPLQNELRSVLTDWSISNEIDFIDDLDAEELKNAVVKGALHYALLYRKHETSTVELTNSNLMARYGVLYNDPLTGAWEYKNLLDPSTRPLKQHPIIKDGMTIYEYDTDIYDADTGNNRKTNYIDMSNTVKGWFVQSYARDTAADINAGNTEYISKIEPIKRDAVDGDITRVRVRIQIDGDNQMHLSVGGDTLDPTTPLRIDLENSESFKKSMWPYL